MKRVIKSLGFIIIIGITAACGGPQGNKATTGDAQEVSVTTGDISLQIDKAASSIEWVGAKPTGKHHGTIKISEGELMLTDGAIVGGKFTIDMNSITNLDLTSADDNAKLTGHLKSPDFFDVAKFPTAMFEITSCQPISGNPEATHNITGNLTLKGISKSVTFPAKVVIDGNQLTASAPEFLIDRTQWNVQYGSKTIFNDLKDKFINDEIALKISLKAGV